MGLKEVIFGGGVKLEEQSGVYRGSIQEWVPVRDIVQGTVVTRDRRFVRVLEVVPLNFYTLSDSEKDAVLADFHAYLKVAPSTLQITVRTQRFRTDDYTARMKKRLEVEPVEACRAMIEDNIAEVTRVTATEAITHRFFLSFEYEPTMKAKDNTPEAVAERMNEVADIARRYLDRCGLEVIEPEYSDNAVLELLYEILNKSTSRRVRLPAGVFDMVSTVHGVYGKEATAIQEAEKQTRDAAQRHGAGRKRKKREVSRLEAGATTIGDILAPTDTDLTHPDYIVVDGVYHAYLYIAGYGYATVVGRGWLTPLIEAGEGVSISFTIKKQSREKAVSAIGQSTMWRRSQMRDVGDTRSDYEELGDAIAAGMFLKNGINREGEDMYYMHTIIEVVADTPEVLEQRISSVETLCVSIDMLAKRCTFKAEQGFLTVLPILHIDSDIERKSRRNVLTSSVAAAFPFASYELSDANGIFLGLNMYNKSPVFLDNYNDYKYPNGNFCAFGSTGAGKSVLLQAIAGRFRQQGKRIIVIIPEKGHEYRPLCEAVGGQFIKLGPSSKDCVGLMDIRRKPGNAFSAIKGLDSRDDSLLAETISELAVWYSLEKHDLTPEEKNLIDASLVECFNRKGITFDNASLEGKTCEDMPTIPEWYAVLKEKEDTRHLATILTRYVTGSAANMGGHTNVDLNNPYIVIDLSDIPEDISLSATYTATRVALDLVNLYGVNGVAVLGDELWKLMGANSNPLAANFLVRLVKLLRSLGGIAGVTSQGMADMYALENGKYGKAIMDSCRIKIAMQLEEQEAALAREKLNLTENEQQMITRFRRGEGLLCIGHNHVPVSFTISEKEYQHITTSPTDLRARMSAQGQ